MAPLRSSAPKHQLHDNQDDEPDHSREAQASDEVLPNHERTLTESDREASRAAVLGASAKTVDDCSDCNAYGDDHCKARQRPIEQRALASQLAAARIEESEYRSHDADRQLRAARTASAVPKH
jgi:hypothetical protein